MDLVEFSRVPAGDSCTPLGKSTATPSFDGNAETAKLNQMRGRQFGPLLAIGIQEQPNVCRRDLLASLRQVDSRQRSLGHCTDEEIWSS